MHNIWTRQDKFNLLRLHVSVVQIEPIHYAVCEHSRCSLLSVIFVVTKSLLIEEQLCWLTYRRRMSARPRLNPTTLIADLFFPTRKAFSVCLSLSLSIAV